MSHPKMRPTFLLETERSVEDVVNCVKDALTNNSGTYRGRFAGEHAMISIDESERHFWSPWLHLEVRELEDKREVFGRFSPHPSIWTGFMMTYLAMATAIFFALMFGFSQMMIGNPPWAFSVIPFALAIAGSLWLASQAGQRLAHAEMEGLSKLIEDSVLPQPGAAESSQERGTH